MLNHLVVDNDNIMLHHPNFYYILNHSRQTCLLCQVMLLDIIFLVAATLDFMPQDVL